MSLPAHPLDDPTIIEALTNAGLGIHADQFAHMLAPCLRLTPASDGPHLLGGSPPADPWPTHARSPLLHVLSLHLPGIHQAADGRLGDDLDGLPGHGMLRAYTQHPDDPAPDFSGTDPDTWRTIHQPTRLGRTQPPPLAQLPGQRMAATLTWSIDVAAAEAVALHIDTDAGGAARRINQFIATVHQAGGRRLHQVGGHPALVREHPARVVAARHIQTADVTVDDHYDLGPVEHPDDELDAIAADLDAGGSGILTRAPDTTTHERWTVLLQVDEDTIDGQRLRWADQGRAWWLRRPNDDPADAIQVIQGW